MRDTNRNNQFSALPTGSRCFNNWLVVVVVVMLLASACRNASPRGNFLSEWQRHTPGLSPRLGSDCDTDSRLLLTPVPIYYAVQQPADTAEPATEVTDFGPAQANLDLYLQAWDELCQKKLPQSIPYPPDSALLPPAVWRTAFSPEDYQTSILHLYRAMNQAGLTEAQKLHLQSLALFQQQQGILSQALNDLTRMNHGQVEDLPEIVANFQKLRQFQQQFAATLQGQILPELCAAAEDFLQPLLPLLNHPECGQPLSALLSLWMAVPTSSQQELPLQSTDSAAWRELQPTPQRYAELADSDQPATAPAAPYTWLVMTFANPTPPAGKLCQLSILPLPADSEVYFNGQQVSFTPNEPLFITLLPQTKQEQIIAIKFSSQELGRQICPPWICSKDAPADNAPDEKKTTAKEQQ